MRVKSIRKKPRVRIYRKTRVIQGDCLEELKRIPDNSVDAIVTDAPYGIAFMGKDWDSFGNPKRKARDHFVEWMEERQKELIRVLKPGGHELCFAGTRTYHWGAWAIESAGFTIRDQMDWIYSQGFPKSLNISKAIQKKQGVKPVARKKASLGMANNPQWNALHTQLVMPPAEGLAAVWEGWETGLKPAHEGIVVAQKPFDGSFAGNVLEWGTGGINIDGCRIGSEPSPSVARRESARRSGRSPSKPGRKDGKFKDRTSPKRYMEPRPGEKLGRYPTNIILDPSAAEMLDEQVGNLGKAGVAVRRHGGGGNFFGGINPRPKLAGPSADCGYGDSGGPSRFFYCAKPSKREKNAGLGWFRRKQVSQRGKSQGVPRDRTRDPLAFNNHPTTKPISLMRYLVRLVTPPGGVVLDPFCGSGTTGCAAVLEGFRFIGIEKESEYAEIAEARIQHWMKKRKRGFFD